MTRQRTTDHDLLSQLGTGTGDWTTFVAIYRGMVLERVRYRVRNDADAEDITQDVMLKLIRRFEKGWQHDEGRGGFRALLKPIIQNCIASHYQRARRQLRGGDDLPDEAGLERATRRRNVDLGSTVEAEPVGETSAEQRLLRGALDELTETDRQILTYDGKLAELARELGKAPGALRARKFKAKRRLEDVWRQQVNRWQTEPGPARGHRFELEHLFWAGQLIREQQAETRACPALLFRRPASTGQRHVETILLDSSTVIGRETFTRLVPALLDGEISGRHCRIERDDGTWVLEDLGSRNHTFVNGRQLSRGEEAVLCDGDRLEIGKQLLVFSTGELGIEEAP